MNYHRLCLGRMPGFHSKPAWWLCFYLTIFRITGLEFLDKKNSNLCGIYRFS